MTNQEKRTKSGELILNLVTEAKKPAMTIAEVEKKTKLPHEEIVKSFRALEDAGMGRFIVGRRGGESRFVKFNPSTDTRAEAPALDIRMGQILDNGWVEILITIDASSFAAFLSALRRTSLGPVMLEASDGGVTFSLRVSPDKIAETVRSLRGTVARPD